MHQRTRRTLYILAAVLALLAVAVFLRSKAPPEAARLLLESAGIVYAGLKPTQNTAMLYSRPHIHATSNDARMNAWRAYENNSRP